MADPYLRRSMVDRLKLAALITVATLAFGILGLIVNNFVASDWRLVGNPFDVGAFFRDDEPELIVDERLSGRTMRFGDSVRSIRIETSHLHINVRGGASTSIDLAIALSGDATDTSRF